MANITIDPAAFPSDVEAVAALFSEYAEALDIDLSFQSFAAECSQLPGKYAAEQGGALFLAHSHSHSHPADPASTQVKAKAIGCVALRVFSAETCELKRLYVQPEARGMRVAQRLIDAAVLRARELGYRHMLLDTLASMTAARRLYVSRGFSETEKYYDNPIPGTVFMRAALDDVDVDVGGT